MFESLKEARSRSQSSIDKFLVQKMGILDICTDIAIDGRPFSHFDSTPVKKLVEYAVLGAKETKQTISGAKVRESVVDRAKECRKKITAQLKNKLIIISGDFATLRGHEFLGEFNR